MHTRRELRKWVLCLQMSQSAGWRLRRGVPERVAMRRTGHQTRDVFDRYNIWDEQDDRRAAELLARRSGGHRRRVEEHSEICAAAWQGRGFSAGGRGGTVI